MSLKEQVPNVYSVGLSNVGSYQVAGTPHLSGPTIADGDETSISFPQVTKNLTINKVSTGGEMRVHFASKGFQKPALEFRDVNTNSTLDNHFVIPTNIASGEAFTIEWWFKFTNTPSVGQISFWNVPHAGPGTYTISSKIVYQSGGQVVFRNDLKDSNGAVQRLDYTISSGFDFGEWCHFVMSVDSTSYKVYVNGSDGGYSASLSSGVAPVSSVVFPRSSTIPTSLVQITLWDKALSDSDVSELYNGGNWTSPKDHSSVSNLTNWYAFDDTATPPDTTDLILDRHGSTDITVSDTSGETDTATFITGPSQFLTGSNVIGGYHYITLTDSFSSITLNCKCSELYLSADGSAQTASVIANLSNISASKMFALTGSGIDE